MDYVDMCAGISAASVAFSKIEGWKPKWFSQYDPLHDYKQGTDFPSKVLAHHYPHVPNLGNMLKIQTNDIFIRSTADVAIAGTPCQSFSLAGLRGGMADKRGSLTLEFCRILAAKQFRWFIWENVPCVHSSFSDEKDHIESSDFKRRSGRQFTDNDDAIVQSSDFARLLEAFHECGYSTCWRIFDSQYFGVPQRRRRVFVVGHLGTDWRPPFAVLFERDSLRRDFTPGKSERETTSGQIVSCLDASYGRLQGASGQDMKHNHSSLVMAYGGNNTSGAIDVATAVKGRNQNIDFESETFLVSDRKQSDNYYDSPVAVDDINMTVNKEISTTLQSKKNGFSLNYNNSIIYPLAQITNKENRSNPNEGNPSPGLDKNCSRHVIIQNTKQKNSSFDSLSCYEDVHPSLKKHNSQNNILQEMPIVIDKAAYNAGMNADYVPEIKESNTSPTIKTTNHQDSVFYRQIIRRLTPLECERLQAFPDEYTFIPLKKVSEKIYLKAKNKSRYRKIDSNWWLMAADSPRYEALGNSMTTNVVEYIGRRVDRVHKLLTKLQDGKK